MSLSSSPSRYKLICKIKDEHLKSTEIKKISMFENKWVLKITLIWKKN